MKLEHIQVLHRTGQWCPGVRTTANVVAYDVPILPQWQAPGRPTTDRCFVLPDEGVQLTKPNTFTGAYEGGWYIDLVDVEEPTPSSVVIHDRDVDILIPPSSLRYDILDLDEFAVALESGTLDLPTAARVLRDTQRFIDRHLRIPGQAPVTGWPDFPPASIQPLIELPPFAA